MVYLKRHLILCAFILYPVLTFSQLSDWVNYTNGDMVTKILNDGDHLWIATDGGLVKFNKSTEEMTFYNRANAGLPDNHLRSLAKDRDGNIWVTTQYNGIGKFDGNNCRVYKASNSEIPTSQECNSILIDNNNHVWAGTLMYLNRFDGESWGSWTTPNSEIDAFWAIYDLRLDNDRVLWMGGSSVTSGFYFAKFTENGIERIEGFRKDVHSIEIDDDNHKWLGTSAGLVKYDGTNFTTYNTGNSVLPGNIIYDVKKDVSDNLWLACGRQLVKFDGTSFTTYETPLITDDNNFIYCLETEDDGTVWAGTRRNGLIKFSNGTFRQIRLSSSPLTTNTISSGLDIDANHNVRFGTKYSMVTVDKDNQWSFSYEKRDNMVSEERIKSVASDFSGNVWIALGISDTCVLKVTENNRLAFTQQNSPLLEGLPEFQFCFDKKGNTWLATRAGLYQYNGTNWQRFTPVNSPLKSYRVSDLATDKNDNLWGAAGDEESGCLFKYDGINWTIYTVENSGLPTHFVSVLAFDSKNNLWTHCRDVNNVVGREYGGGLTQFDGATWTTYNINNSGIPSNSIMDITVDREDNLWLATVGRVGVTQFDGTDWKSYNVDNSGIALDEVSKITLDYYRDCVWLNHRYSSGLSVAKLNAGTGINSIRQETTADLTIYPNPAKTDIHIRMNQGEEINYLEVFDISGKMISFHNMPKSMSNSVIYFSLADLNICNNGMYFIRINGKTEGYTQKLMVKK